MAHNNPLDELRQEQEKKRLLRILSEIANSAQFAIYYQENYSVRELNETIQNIRTLTEREIAVK